MKLLVENIDSAEVIVESEGDKRRHYIQGIFLQAGVENRNHRIYPPHIMEREVNRYIKEKVETGSAYGELGHPTTGPQINLDRVSHIIKELHRDGNNWVGKAQLIPEGMGKIAIGLSEAGAHLGVSSRALGSTKQVGGIMEVQPDFRLFSVDIVGNPSAPEAYVSSIMESAEWVWDNGILKEKDLVAVKESINRAAATHDKRKLNEAVLKAWTSLWENIE